MDLSPDKKVEVLRKVAKKYRTSEMDEILPNLYLGSYFAAKDTNELRRRNVKNVICCLEIDQKTNVYGEEITVLRIPVSDSLTAVISTHFQKAIEFIHLARSRGEGILVHCLAGVSRSVTIICCYLMTITDLGFLGSLGYIILRRHSANPNSGFRMQLNEYAKEDMEAKRRLLCDLVGKEAYERLRETDLKATNLSSLLRADVVVIDQST